MPESYSCILKYQLVAFGHAWVSQAPPLELAQNRPQTVLNAVSKWGPNLMLPRRRETPVGSFRRGS